MATGSWDHTAELIATQVNFARAVISMFGSRPPQYYSPLDAHPYRHRSPRQELDKQLSAEMVKIAKLPFEQRRQARYALQQRYAAELEQLNEH